MLKLYQVFYGNDQPLDKGCIPHDARGVDVYPLYENKHILDIYPTLEGADYYGVTSWRMKEKTALTKEKIDEFIEKHPRFNAYLYGRQGEDDALSSNHSTSIGVVWRRLAELGVFKDPELPRAELRNCFCNYWIADKETWDRYIPYLKHVLMLFETDPVLSWVMKTITFPHRKQQYPLHPFVLEYLFPLFLEDNLDIKVKEVPAKLSGTRMRSQEKLKRLSLSEIYEFHKTEDAGMGDKGTLHTYIDTYDRLFTPYRHEPISMLEIGVQEGYSLRMWRDYFSQARITGMDIKRPTQNITGCWLRICDQSDPIALEETFKNTAFDIILDDGSHDIEHQIISRRELYPKLRTGGLYLIEDIQNPESDIPRLEQEFGPVEVFDFRDYSKRYDDVIVGWRKV